MLIFTKLFEGICIFCLPYWWKACRQLFFSLGLSVYTVKGIFYRRKLFTGNLLWKLTKTDLPASQWSLWYWHPQWRPCYHPRCQTCPPRHWCRRGWTGGCWSSGSGWCEGAGRRCLRGALMERKTGSWGGCSLHTPSSFHRSRGSGGRASPQCLETSVGRKVKSRAQNRKQGILSGQCQCVLFLIFFIYRGRQPFFLCLETMLLKGLRCCPFPLKGSAHYILWNNHVNIQICDFIQIDLHCIFKVCILIRSNIPWESNPWCC